MAGTLAVRMHDAMLARQWLAADGKDYALTPLGEASLAQIGVDAVEARRRRRRFACPCLDWSERRPHLGGALGAALLDALTERGWVSRDLDSRALRLTRKRAPVPGVLRRCRRAGRRGQDWDIASRPAAA